jgi:hypothetical protein
MATLFSPIRVQINSLTNFSTPENIGCGSVLSPERLRAFGRTESK